MRPRPNPKAARPLPMAIPPAQDLWGMNGKGLPTGLQAKNGQLAPTYKPVVLGTLPPAVKAEPKGITNQVKAPRTRVNIPQSPTIGEQVASIKPPSFSLNSHRADTLGERAANLEFGSLIRGLKTQVGMNRGQGRLATEDVRGAFNDAAGVARSQGKENQAFQKSLQKQFARGLRTVRRLPGLDAGRGGLAGNYLQNQATAVNVGDLQSKFLGNLRAIAAQEGAFQGAQTQKRYANQEMELMDKLSDARRERGLSKSLNAEKFQTKLNEISQQRYENKMNHLGAQAETGGTGASAAEFIAEVTPSLNSGELSPKQVVELARMKDPENAGAIRKYVIQHFNRNQQAQKAAQASDQAAQDQLASLIALGIDPAQISKLAQKKINEQMKSKP